MLSLALIERRIKEVVKGEHTDETVKEFAMLCLARDYLLAEIREEEAGQAMANPRVILTNYCADLNAIPTMEQIGLAINAAASRVRTPEDRQKMETVKTWAEIIGQGEF